MTAASDSVLAERWLEEFESPLCPPIGSSADDSPCGEQLGLSIDDPEPPPACTSGIALRALTLTARPMPLRQFQLLAVLDEMGRSGAAQVAGALRLTVPSVTRLADRRVASGHLLHRPHLYDRSVATFELTQAGRDLVSRVMHWRHHELDRILRRLPPAERLAAANALRAFLQAAAGSGYGTDHLTVGSTDPVTAA